MKIYCLTVNKLCKGKNVNFVLSFILEFEAKCPLLLSNSTLERTSR
jgi:hypothetical protein